MSEPDYSHLVAKLSSHRSRELYTHEGLKQCAVFIMRFLHREPFACQKVMFPLRVNEFCEPDSSPSELLFRRHGKATTTHKGLHVVACWGPDDQLYIRWVTKVVYKDELTGHERTEDSYINESLYGITLREICELTVLLAVEEAIPFKFVDDSEFSSTKVVSQAFMDAITKVGGDSNFGQLG